MTSKELYENLTPSTETLFRHAYLTEHGLEINLEGMYSKFIKDAARCNAYNSDVYYDIHYIEEMLESFDPENEFEPIWVGFRKMGVDGTSFVLCKTDKNNTHASMSNNYFALYSVNIVPAEYDCYDIVLREYNV